MTFGIQSGLECSIWQVMPQFKWMQSICHFCWNKVCIISTKSLIIIQACWFWQLLRDFTLVTDSNAPLIENILVGWSIEQKKIPTWDYYVIRIICSTLMCVLLSRGEWWNILVVFAWLERCVFHFHGCARYSQVVFWMLLLDDTKFARLWRRHRAI